MENIEKKMVLIYTTFPDAKVARTIGKILVEEGLAACVNIFESMQSIYKWEGEVHEERECAAFIKSTNDRSNKLKNRLKHLHPYDLPALFVINTESIDPDYKNWLDSQLM